MHTLAQAPARSRRRFMPEIQGLRAVAVGLVVLFHLWPADVPGGFVGVDVFFVISGYLMTNIILDEIQNKRFNFYQFFLKRIKRIVPAESFLDFTDYDDMCRGK